MKRLGVPERLGMQLLLMSSDFVITGLNRTNQFVTFCWLFCSKSLY